MRLPRCAHGEITEAPHTRRREATLPAVAAGAVGVGGERDAQEARHKPQRGPAPTGGYWMGGRKEIAAHLLSK